MAAKPSYVDKPVWVDLASSDPAAARAFYAHLFGWTVEVDPDPRYGGYAVAELDGERVAGVGPKMMAEAPDAWSLYIGTDDADDLAGRVTAAGGTVIAGPMTVGDQGRMAVFADPCGAVIGAWQPISMAGFSAGRPDSFGWAELNARGLDRAVVFYHTVFGWEARPSPMPDGSVYNEFGIGDQMIAGGQEMPATVPAAVPSYWLPYFTVRDVDASYAKALAAGAGEMLGPTEFPGGRFAILADPQGAAFGLLIAPQG
jgi:uncharacterized protein